MPKLKPHFSPVRRADNLFFVSGQMPFDANMRIVGGDIVAQTRACLDNIAQVLSTAGVGLSDVVRVTVWLARVEDFPRFNETYATYFPDSPPARSTVRSDLMVPGALIEIEATAYKAPTNA